MTVSKLNKGMKDLKNFEKTALLPQYQKSELMYERFLDATLNESENIFRTKKEPGTKLAGIDENESLYDNLNYFTNPINKKQLEGEFLHELYKESVKNKLIGSVN